MAFDKNFVDTPAEKLGEIPSGYKGSGTHKYDGEEDGAFSSYRRTNSPNGVPEVYCDENVKPSGEPLGKDGEYK